ncbi:MAG: signal peptidase I [Isosphaeraceae bacterium]
MDESRRRRWKRTTATVLLSCLVGLLGFFVSKARSYELFLIPSSSMSPTIAVGDRVVVDKEMASPPARAEIWVFRMPPRSGTPGSIAIKRVIGLPGESIGVRDGKVWIDGEPLDEPYLGSAPNYTLDPVTLGDDEYFVMGDNRSISLDSHIWGPVPAGQLVGRARARCWPASRASGL